MLFLPLLLTISTIVTATPSPSNKKRASLPPHFTVSELGTTFDTSFPNVYRDNGGGGNIGGLNFVVFSDTTVTNGGRNGALSWFVSNSVAAIDYNDPTNPLNLFDIGTAPNPKEFIPRQSNETDGSVICIWPNSNLVPLSSGNSGVAVYPVIKRDAAINGGYDLYSTLVTVTATAYGPVAVRTVPQLFYVGEIYYGSFSMVKGVDGYIYMFAANSGTVAPGVKVARVPEANVANRASYTYWNGKIWATTPPLASDTASNIFNYSGAYGYGPASGDIYWNSYYNTWVAIFFDTFVDGMFRMMYSLTSDMTGAWSTEQDLYSTTAESGSYNYAGHAYPGVDAGQTLLLSWTYGGNLTKMARVSWS